MVRKRLLTLICTHHFLGRPPLQRAQHPPLSRCLWQLKSRRWSNHTHCNTDLTTLFHLAGADGEVALECISQLGRFEGICVQLSGELRSKSPAPQPSILSFEEIGRRRYGSSDFTSDPAPGLFVQVLQSRMSTSRTIRTTARAHYILPQGLKIQVHMHSLISVYWSG